MMVAILSRRSQKQTREIRRYSSRFVYLAFVSRYRCVFLLSFVIITMFAVIQTIDVLGLRRLLRGEVSFADSNMRGSNSIGDNNNNNSNNDVKEYDFFNITFLNNIQTMKCGGRKCFIIAGENENEYENNNESNSIKKIGYIIAQDNRIIHQNRENPISSDMYKAWDIARTLKQEYNSSTLLQGPPQKLCIRDEQFFEKLNSIEIQSDPGHFIPPGVGNFSSANGPLIIQQSEIIPQPSMMWHINMYLSNENYRKPMLYADFISNHVVQQMGNNIEQFESRLLRNLNTTKQFLVNQYPCLLNDLQFIVDYKGDIHHIDLDRCYDITETEIAKKRIAYMNIFDDAIQQFKLAVRIAKSL